jgi:cysteine desulfurase
VLLAIGRPHEVAHGSLRLSISEETTPQEVETIISSVADVVDYLRNMSPFWRDLMTGKRQHVFDK